MQEKVFDIIFDKNEITWQSMLYELVKSEQMDPWDIDISLLTKRFLEMLSKLKEMDFSISGKVVLAAAILLKIKSNKLVGEDILQFDKMFEEPEEDQISDLYEDDTQVPKEDIGKVPLIPRTPQPRKRKVSIYDLMAALERALEVKRRRVLSTIPPSNLQVPEKKRDISEIIKDIYGRIKSFLLRSQGKTVLFSQLIPSEKKEDKIYTFIPLLHLANKRQVALEQKEHFGEIEIMLRSEKEVNDELSES